jgi:NAD(P)-dependent dehydrogenase (short-subunit alcohol dehydrogenase family)
MKDNSKPRSILITGASSGIGLCAAQSLCHRGYQVIAAVRKREDMSRLEQEGIEAVQLDLANSASIQTAVDKTLERTQGRLYALFNNGAYGQPGAVEDLSREMLREQFEVNLFGPHELTRCIIPIMRTQGYGRIIQTSSVLGLVALKYRGAYNATKFALEGLSDTLRMELAGTGIEVILIEPGPILSRFRENAYAAYKRHIDWENSPHRATYEAIERRLQTEGAVVPFTLPPEAVVKSLVQALESSRPKLRYYITLPTYLFAFLKRVLPARFLDRILSRI